MREQVKLFLAVVPAGEQGKANQAELTVDASVQ